MVIRTHRQSERSGASDVCRVKKGTTMKTLSEQSGAGKSLLQVACFMLVGVLLFLCVQSVMTLKWEFPNPSPLNVLENAEQPQVLLLGASNIYSSILPMDIYEEYGITALDLASPGQQMQLSYALLAEALEKWTPEVAVLEISGLLAGPTPDLSYWLLTLTDTPASRTKLHNARIYAEAAAWNSEEVNYNEALFGAFVPLYQFHSRWTELGRNDFVRQDSGLDAAITKGGLVLTGVLPSVITADEMNDVASAMVQEDKAEATYIYSGKVSREDLDEGPIYSVQLDPYDGEYLEKIVQLCREKQISLELIKIPNVNNPVEYNNAWTWQKHKLVMQYAQSQGIPFLDLLYDVDLELDWDNDSYDGGIHTNIRGARKISAYLGQYLKDTYQLAAIQEPSYEWAVPYFKLSESLALEQTERELDAWIDWIQNSYWDLTVAMAVCEDMSLGLTEENIRTLQSIGLQTDFGAMSFGDTFLAIWEHSGDGTDTIPYEMTSNRELTYAYRAPGGGTLISLLSRGGYQYANVSIKVDDLEQTEVIRGLHFTVYDHASGLVLDDMWVDFSAGGTIIHWNSNAYLRDFERWINETVGEER